MNVMEKRKEYLWRNKYLITDCLYHRKNEKLAEIIEPYSNYKVQFDLDTTQGLFKASLYNKKGLLQMLKAGVIPHSSILWNSIIKGSDKVTKLLLDRDFIDDTIFKEENLTRLCIFYFNLKNNQAHRGIYTQIKARNEQNEAESLLSAFEHVINLPISQDPQVLRAKENIIYLLKSKPELITCFEPNKIWDLLKTYDSKISKIDRFRYSFNNQNLVDTVHAALIENEKNMLEKSFLETKRSQTPRI